MRVLLSYMDPARGEQSSAYNENDLREWLDDWPNRVAPTRITLKRISDED